MAIKVHQKLVFINTLYKVTPSSDCLVHALAHFLGFLASLSLAVCDVRAQVMKWRMSLIRKHLDLTLCHFVYQQVTLIDVPYIKGKCTFYNEIIRFYILVFFGDFAEADGRNEQCGRGGRTCGWRAGRGWGCTWVVGCITAPPQVLYQTTQHQIAPHNTIT